MIYSLLRGFLFSAGSFLLFLAGISPKDAHSNLAGWSSLVLDSPPMWLQTENFDTLVGITGIVFLVAFLITLIFKKNSPTVNQVNISSHNQSGGITAQNVLVGQTGRRLTPEINRELKEKSQGKDSFSIYCVASDNEAFSFAMEIKSALLTYGLEYISTTISTGLVGGEGKIWLSIEGSRLDITVGPNSTYPIALEDKGGVAQNLGPI